MLEHLFKPYSKPIRQGIIFALDVPAARKTVGKDLVTLLVKAFKEKNESLRDHIGDALATVAIKEDIDEIMELASDSSYGGYRCFLLDGVARLRGDAAIPFLISLLDDKDIFGFAINALGKLKAKSAAPKIRPFLSHPDSFFRQEAKRTLKKIEAPPKKSSCLDRVSAVT